MDLSTFRLVYRTVALGALCSLGFIPAHAGQLAIRVSDVALSQNVIYAGQTVDLTYTLAGSGMGITGGLVDVKIEFLQGATVAKTITLTPGTTGTATGANTVVLSASDIPAGGPFSVRVSASGGSVSGTDYFQVSSLNDPYMQFYNPRGVDVNRVTGSPYLGRIYVTEGGGGSTTHRTTIDGVYVLNPDLSPAFPAPKATSALIGALGPWGGTANSPYRPVVGPDGLLYISDGSDAHGGVYVADPDVNTVQSLFAYPAEGGPTRDSNGVVSDLSGNPLNGSTTTVWIEGSGAGRTIFTMDEDLYTGNAMLKRVVPAGTTNSTALPEFVLGPMGFWEMDMVKDSAGNIYAVSTTANEAIKYNSDGVEVARLGDTGAGYFGIDIDDARNMVLLSTNDGRIIKTDKSFTTPTPLLTGLGTNVRDVAIDKEGWIYTLSSSSERLVVFAPPGTYPIAGGNASAAGTIQVGGGGLAGDVDNDGKVTVKDAAIVIRIASGLQ